MKKLHKTLIAFFVLLLFVVVGVTWYFLREALYNPKHHFGFGKFPVSDYLSEHPTATDWVMSLRESRALRDTFVIMNGEEHHHAYYYVAKKPTNKVAMLIHGHTKNALYMLHLADIYAKMGYNLWLPDLYGHGLSEDVHAQMGWRERKDVLQWADIANRKFKGDSLQTQMLVHGVSMGAAATMCVSGEKTPDFLKCFVEDCGYTDVWEEFSYQLKAQFGLPPFPFLHTASLACKARFGWSFKEASPLRQVAKCRKPMLFIHGDKDDYVPFFMVRQLYDAKPRPKEMYVSHGAVHANAFDVHPEEYTTAVENFVNKYVY